MMAYIGIGLFSLLCLVYAFVLAAALGEWIEDRKREQRRARRRLS